MGKGLDFSASGSQSSRSRMTAVLPVGWFQFGYCSFCSP